MKTAISSLVGVTLLATSVMPTLPELTPALLNTTAFTSVAPVAGAGLPVMPADSDIDPALTQTVTGNEKVAPKGERVEISAGHVDMGATLSDSFELMARDDTTPEPVWRHLDDVVFVIGEEGKLTVPDDPAYAFTKAEGQAWVIPQHEIEGVPWLGWNTQSPKVVDTTDHGVNLEFGGHEGEGDFSLFLQSGGFSQPQQLWNSRLAGNQPMWVELNTHTHANWVFTKPGVHLIGARVVVKDKDGVEHTNEQVLRFAVGDGTDPQQAAQATFKGPWRSADGDVGEQEDAEKRNSSVLWVLGGLALVVAVVGLAGAALMRRARATRDEALTEMGGDA